MVVPHRRSHSRRQTNGRRQRPPALVPRRRARRCAGEASKLAGALSWGASHQFRRVGRAMVRPLFQHAHGYGKRLSGNVRDSLSWWHEVLSNRIVEMRKFKASGQAPVLMWADARGSPPRLAAVALIDGQWHFCDMEPRSDIMRRTRCAPPRRAPGRAEYRAQPILAARRLADYRSRDFGRRSRPLLLGDLSHGP